MRSSVLAARRSSPSFRLFHVSVALLAAGCTAESDPNESVPASNPVERRVEPVRQRATEADSLIRLREREVQDLTRPGG